MGRWCVLAGLVVIPRVAAAANGYVTFGDYDGHVYSINSVTRAALTAYPMTPGTSADIFESAPLYRDGVIVIGSRRGSVSYEFDSRLTSPLKLSRRLPDRRG